MATRSYYVDITTTGPALHPRINARISLMKRRGWNHLKTETVSEGRTRLYFQREWEEYPAHERAI